jgi:hypothetical protein
MLKEWLGPGWKQSLTCRVYVGMTEAQEADMFDWLNNTLPVGAFDRFKIRVTAGRQVEVDVKKVVEAAGLHIGNRKLPGGISAVSTLVRIAERSNPATLGRSLRLAHNSFGDAGLTNAVIDGFAQVCDRYNGQLQDAPAIARLNAMRGGVSALMGRAEVLHKQTRRRLGGVAAAVVDVPNSQRAGQEAAIVVG